MERVFYLPSQDIPRARLAVRFDGDDPSSLVDIADEDVTSDGPGARRLDSPANAVRRLAITNEEAAWLRDALVALDLGPSPVAVPPVERTPEVGATYTRAQFAAAVDEAHSALHEHGELVGPLWRAHEALHNVGAGQERIACATPDPEAQAIHADLRALRDREIPCGHTVADLIGGTEKGPDGRERPSITKCGACLAIRQPEIIAARQAKAAAERTPEVVLRAMLRAYEAYVVRKETAMLRDADMAAKAGWEAALGDLAHVRRAVVLLPIFGEVRLFDSALADYEARLRGERPLDAPPLEVP